MNEQNAQAQEKPNNKIRSMSSKSSAATQSVVPSANKM